MSVECMKKERKEGAVLPWRLGLLLPLLTYYFLVLLGFQFIPFKAIETRNGGKTKKKNTVNITV